MSLDPYELKSNPNSLSFEFYSQGPKGQIKKVIQFNKLKVDGETIYNLGFGDFNEKNQKIDDLIVTNNKDRDKILATVASSVLSFFEHHPNARVAFKGSTPERTRLYIMKISSHLEQLNLKVTIEGLTADGWESFRKNRVYTVLLITPINKVNS